MRFTGRTRELGRIRRALDGPLATLIRVHGIRGGGKSALVRRVLEDYSCVTHRCPPLPDLAQRAALAARLGSHCRTHGLDGAAPDANADWSTLFESARALARSTGRPFVFVLDDAHRLVEARSRYQKALLTLLTDGAAGRLARSADHPPVHMVLVGDAATLPTFDDRPTDAIPGGVESIDVGPLNFRAAAALLPGARPEDRLRAYGVFGGIPATLACLDRSLTVETNIRKLLLEAGGPIVDPAIQLERDVQSPARYNAILTTLASGETDWSTVHAGLPELTRSGQVAPYLKRLSELGLVAARSSLDAGPRSRSRRYAITDPFVAFWYRFVLPFRMGCEGESAADYYARVVRADGDAHVERVFSAICRQHMSHDSIETLGAVAREGGSLWGVECELPIAGILTSGAAYYGACSWSPPTRNDSPLDRIDRNLSATRYGFGRERRLRLVFTGKSTPGWLRRDIARREDAVLIDAEALAG